MTDKIFGADFADDANPQITWTLSLNNGTVLKDVTTAQFLKIISGLTADSTPASGDSMLTWDVSASDVKQVLLSNLHKALTQATDTQAGTIELATVAETQTGTDTTRAVTPADLAASVLGGYRVTGLVGANNATTPNTKYDFSADQVVLRNPSNGSIAVRTSTGTITNDVGLAGSAANGRDQAGAFSASSWIHFYFIWNGTTLATVSSATAPTTGPTLPSGYTHWAYIGAIRFNGSSQLVVTRIRGCNVFYSIEQVLVSAGTATTETAVDTSAFVPPNAGSLFGKVTALFSNATPNTNISVDIRIISAAANFLDISITTQVANLQMRTDTAFLAPNLSQNLYYLWSAATAGRSLYLICTGYTVPNGG